MARPAYPSILNPLIVLVGVGLVVFQLARNAHDVSLQGWREGIAGYRAAVAEQERTGKPIALFFFTDWCSACKAFREDILTAPELKDYMSGVIAVKVNPETSPAAQALADRFRVGGFPTFYMVPARPKPPAQIATSRHLTPGQFVTLCRNAVAI
jgi:thiol:disulfide interchange protein